MTPTSTAFHEAAHAVVARVLKQHVSKVELLPHSAGRCWNSKGYRKGGQTPAEYARDRCCIIYAGPEAERLMHGSLFVWTREAAWWLEGVTNRDSVIARNIAKHYGISRRELRQLRREARELVIKYWPQITRVARGLQRARSLDGVAVDDLARGLR